MTVEEVRNAVAHVEAIKEDDETAHSAEDAIYVNVLRAIAEGAPNAADLAREALKAEEIMFNRWCA